MSSLPSLKQSQAFETCNRTHAEVELIQKVIDGVDQILCVEAKLGQVSAKMPVFCLTQVHETHRDQRMRPTECFATRGLVSACTIP